MEAVKPPNLSERRAAEPVSMLGSAGRGGHRQRGKNRECETGLCSWEAARNSAEAVL